MHTPLSKSVTIFFFFAANQHIRMISEGLYDTGVMTSKNPALADMTLMT